MSYHLSFCASELRIVSLGTCVVFTFVYEFEFRYVCGVWFRCVCVAECMSYHLSLCAS